MSLQRRLLLVLVVAGAALLAAAAMTFETIKESDAVRLRAASAIAGSMADRLRALPRSAASCRAVLVEEPEVAVGFCAGGGDPGPALARGAHGELIDHPLPPDLREAVGRGCAGTNAEQRIVHPHDVATVRVAEGAWAVVRTQTVPLRGSAVPIAALAVASLVLVALTSTSLRSIRTGAAALARSLSALKSDLRARVVRPEVRELEVVADGLSEMATHLADSIDRERALGRRLAHEQRLAALGRVVAGVAHEVRNPLTGIKLRLDLLRGSPGVARSQLDEVEGALGEVERLDRLVTLLLSTSRQPAAKTEVAVHDVVDARLALLSEHARNHATIVSRRGEATLVTDPDALARIVDNLVRNAIEASTVVVVQVNDGDPVTLEVIDQGDGASDPTLLFEPFVTTKPDGLGLGLFLARTTAESLGGALDYRRDAASTSLCLTLPRS